MMNRSFFIGLLIVLTSCSNDATQLSEQEINSVRTIGEPAAAELMRQLKGALVSIIQDSGIVNAIQVCKKIAPQISQSVSVNVPDIVNLSRTSFKVRNTMNEPDAVDLSALRYFENQIKSVPASTSAFYVVNDGTNYRYYQPIFIQPLCLNCHGDKSTMQKEVLTAIEKNYPMDKAYGYSLKDFRGLIRIKIAKEKKSS
jgi:hypothetical protein